MKKKSIQLTVEIKSTCNKKPHEWEDILSDILWKKHREIVELTIRVNNGHN